jgi:hypothetical protein
MEGDNSQQPVVGKISQLPHNKLRLGYGSQIYGKVLYNFRSSTGAGMRDITEVSQIKIPISSANPNAFLNPAESVLRCKFKITGGANTALGHDKEKYIFRGASSFIRSLKTSHLTKGTTFEKIDNADMLVQLSKSMLPHSYWDSLCWDVDGSSINNYIVDTKAELNTDYSGVFDNNKYRADGSSVWSIVVGGVETVANATVLKQYDPVEVNRTINRTLNKEVEVEIPLVSGLLSSSNNSLIPLFHCPVELQLDLNNIATIFKMTAPDAVTKVECEFRYLACIYNMSDEVAKEVAVLANGEGLYFDIERIENISVRVPSSASNFANTFNFQQVSSLQSAITTLSADAAMASSSRDRYMFGDGSSHNQVSPSYVNSLQYSIGTELFPRERLEMKPYNYSVMHTLAKSSILSDGTKVVYQTDSNGSANFLGENALGAWVPGLADKFHLSMAFSNLSKDAYKSGLSLVNSPLNIELNFANAPAENLVLNLWLVHQSEIRVTTSDVTVKR